ncbi:PAS domain S-box-containing protein [Haloplanus vescus]|uniref:PAS domain S-box-containing protein n=1 Tax=Haloplanus vescus TaxID=555874 RepID=A0A1H3ZKI8_9EURY|nr:response regulator [Haloplanus vescus]SEA23941.1 PAS domain S-box-containing protein [Haloplanus vescus]
MDGPIRVLHVDDEPDFANLAATFLEREDDRFEVTTATNVGEGLDRLAELDADCIVSDYDMPDQNGIEFLETVRTDHPKLPFILFTGRGSESIASRAVSAGVTEYLQKESGRDQYMLLANRITNSVRAYRAETAVTRSEERYHNLVDTAPIPIIVFDREGTLLYSNDAAVDFLNADTHADLEDRSFTDFLHPDDRERARGRFERLMTEGVSLPEAEFRLRAIDGEIKPATVATAPGYYRGQKVAQAMAYQ